VFIGRRIRLCGSRSRAQSAPRCFARDCARLAALTVRSANLKSATTDGLAWTSRGPLDDARQRRYSEVLFDGCNSQPPSHRPMWSTLIGGPGHDSFFFSRFTPWSATRTTTCPRIARSDRTAFRPQARRQIRSYFKLTSSHCHGYTPATRRYVRSRTQCCPSIAERGRETGIDVQHGAGVSWPNDDDISAGGGENVDRILARTRTGKSTREVTTICGPSSEYLRVTRRASSSRRNRRVTRRRLIEGRRQ
jgi:hypothetical protein